MNPDEVYAQILCLGYELLLVKHVDAHLRCLAKIEVGGVYVHYHGGTFQVFHDGICRLFGHGAVGVAWEDAVHVEVKIGYASLDGVDAEWIEGGPYLHRTIEFFDVFLYAFGHFVTYELAFQFVAVCAGDDAETPCACSVLQDVLADAELFVDGHFV